MKAVHGSLFIFLCLASVAVAIDGTTQQEGDGAGSGKNSQTLSVLVVTTPDAGHALKIAAIGEALVTRGHSVTLCSTEREGSDVVRKTAARIGLNFLSAGPDHLSQKDFLELHRRMHDAGALRGALAESVNYFKAATEQFAKYLDTQLSLVEQFDVVVVDQMISIGVACIAKRFNIPTIVVQPTFDFADPPQWPFPLILSGFGDKLTFLQRFILALQHFAFNKVLRFYFFNSQLRNLPAICSANYSSYLSGVYGTTMPLIVGTVMGFEYPRTVLPMTHYVGSITLKSTEAVPEEMDSWLKRKDDRSVVYISMGSTAHISRNIGSAIVNGITATNYSVVWSLRKANRDILEGLEVDEDRFFIADWVPQQALLQHRAIRMSIVHGGMGGVSECLYNAVPLIVIPFGLEHWDTAARVQDSGTGLFLDPSSIEADDIEKAVETVGSAGYKLAAEKLHKLFIQAGGAERVAELVEFYTEVGYDHLVPAYAKYEWSWVVYYNIDVYAILSSFILVCIYCSIRFCCCICRVAFKHGQKDKTD